MPSPESFSLNGILRVMASRIVSALIEDLTSRRGLRHEWEQIDEEVQAEIRKTWRGIICDQLDGRPVPAPPRYVFLQAGNVDDLHTVVNAKADEGYYLRKIVDCSTEHTMLFVASMELEEKL